jgi:4-amino-4-deoxy-L-arabinose transferase-like glycosyltransferase
MKKILRTDTFILLAILLLAAIFRFYKLRTTPDWFMDEGEFIRLGDYLSKGNYDLFGIKNSLLLIGRPPLFFWVLAGAFKIFGTDIIVLRSLTALCSIVSVGVCYIFIQQALGRKPAIYSAFLLAILTEYIHNNRIGFTYNWTSLWMLIFVFALWKYHKQDSQRLLVTACLAAGVAFASDYVGIICILIIIIDLLLTRPKQLWKIIIAGIPWLVSMLPIFIKAPFETFHDLVYTFFWGSGGVGGNLIFILARILTIYPVSIQGQSLVLLGMIGIFTIFDQRLRILLLSMVCGVFAIFSFSKTITGHYLLPIWPFLMIGLGNFVDKAVTFIFTNIKLSLINLKISQSWKINNTSRTLIGSFGSILLVFVFVFLPISWMIILNIQGFISKPANPSELQKIPFSDGFIPAVDAEVVAGEISEKINPEDFVIAPGVVSWMVHCNVADIRQVAMYEFGGQILDNPEIAQDRFTVNSSLSNAKFAVVDDTWRYWFTDMAPEIASMLDEVKKWPLVMTQGTLQLYCNPANCP